MTPSQAVGLLFLAAYGLLYLWSVWSLWQLDPSDPRWDHLGEQMQRERERELYRYP